MDTEASYLAANMGLVYKAASQAMGRLQAVESSYEFTDMVQEMAVVFVKSYRLFNPEHGKFSTYFMTSAHHRVNALVNRWMKEKANIGMTSIESISGRISAQTGGDLNYSDVVPSNDATPDMVAEEAELFDLADRTLSPLALKVAELAIDPPDSFESELRSQQAHAAICRAMGDKTHARQNVDAKFVCDILEKTAHFSSAELSAARSELRRFIERHA